jgi:hypothetical protein
MSTEPIIYLRVSSLSHSDFCNKRAKIESFTKFSNEYSTGSIVKGNKLHKQYSYALKSFDRVRCRKLLGEGQVYTKRIDNVEIRGMYDDLVIINDKGKKYASLIELKTTGKPYMWTREVQSAIRQLQLYMWLYKDKLEEIGYPLWHSGILEIYSQNSGELLRRITVEEDEHIEDWIRDVVEKFKGLSRVEVPPYKYCRLCPKNVKIKCDWFIKRSKKVIAIE